MTLNAEAPTVILSDDGHGVTVGPYYVAKSELTETLEDARAWLSALEAAEAHFDSLPTELDLRATEAGRLVRNELFPTFGQDRVPDFYIQTARIIIKAIDEGLV